MQASGDMSHSNQSATESGIIPSQLQQVTENEPSTSVVAVPEHTTTPDSTEPVREQPETHVQHDTGFYQEDSLPGLLSNRVSADQIDYATHRAEITTQPIESPAAPVEEVKPHVEAKPVISPMQSLPVDDTPKSDPPAEDDHMEQDILPLTVTQDKPMISQSVISQPEISQSVNNESSLSHHEINEPMMNDHNQPEERAPAPKLKEPDMYEAEHQPEQNDHADTYKAIGNELDSYKPVENMESNLNNTEMMKPDINEHNESEVNTHQMNEPVSHEPETNHFDNYKPMEDKPMISSSMQYESMDKQQEVDQPMPEQQKSDELS